MVVHAVMESRVQGQPWLFTVVLKAKLLNWLHQTLSMNNLQNEFRNGSLQLKAVWRGSVLPSLCHLCSSVPLDGVRHRVGEVESGPHFGSPSLLSGSRQPLLLSGSLQFSEFFLEQILEYRDPFALGVQP